MHVDSVPQSFTKTELHKYYLTSSVSIFQSLNFTHHCPWHHTSSHILRHRYWWVFTAATLMPLDLSRDGHLWETHGTEVFMSEAYRCEIFYSKCRSLKWKMFNGAADWRHTRPQCRMLLISWLILKLSEHCDWELPATFFFVCVKGYYFVIIKMQYFISKIYFMSFLMKVWY